MTPDEKLKRDIAEYLAKGGTIQQVDSSANAGAKIAFISTGKGKIEYVDKEMAKKRQEPNTSRPRGKK